MFAVNSNDLVAMFITAEGPLNCLSLHKDCTQVVAASRNGKLHNFILPQKPMVTLNKLMVINRTLYLNF